MVADYTSMQLWMSRAAVSRYYLTAAHLTSFRKEGIVAFVTMPATVMPGSDHTPRPSAGDSSRPRKPALYLREAGQ